MKKYSIIAAMLLLFGVSLTSCHASAKVGTDHHEVSAGAGVH